jgi:preprotein translocase subunit SecG
MNLIVGLLTLVLVFVCLLLILLVLVQLPKKDAGAGMAFGGGTADALFGAGSGNALTKITKWTAGIFLGLALFLGFLQGASRNDTSASGFISLVDKQGQQTTIPASTPATAPTSAQGATPAGKGLLSTSMALTSSNVAAPASNSVPVPAK